MRSLFTDRKRIFIETVSGCNNRNCTSPCSAHGKPLKLMDFALFRELLCYLRQYEYEIYLFGQGDASLYPFEEATIDYSDVIINLTPKYFYRLPLLASMGFKIFLRYDSVEDLDLEINGSFCGAFIVIGIREKKDYLYTANTMLERGYPFMVRSMCNKPIDNPPIPLPDVLREIQQQGIHPDRIVSGKHPMENCNVPTIRQAGNQLLFKKCINHDVDYDISNLDDIIKEIEQWDCVNNPVDFCFECATNSENYRIYFEPNNYKGGQSNGRARRNSARKQNCL